VVGVAVSSADDSPLLEPNRPDIFVGSSVSQPFRPLSEPVVTRASYEPVGYIARLLMGDPQPAMLV
jgi:hypothetical protein